MADNDLKVDMQVLKTNLDGIKEQISSMSKKVDDMKTGWDQNLQNINSVPVLQKRVNDAETEMKLLAQKWGVISWVGSVATSLVLTYLFKVIFH